jgi:hypothetical protein
MIKTKKLKIARETLRMLSSQTLQDLRGGIGVTTKVSAAPANCEPSGIIACPTQVPRCA